jgi:hypothetical protein
VQRASNPHSFTDLLIQFQHKKSELSDELMDGRSSSCFYWSLEDDSFFHSFTLVDRRNRGETRNENASENYD